MTASDITTPTHHAQAVTATASKPDDTNMIWSALAVFVGLWAGSAMMFGLPGIYLPALALVPVMTLLIVIFAWG